MIRTLSAVLAVGVVSTAGAADPPAWPQFRGPAGAGVADAQHPPTKIGPNDNVKWKVAVPPGVSSPVIVGDRLFLTAFDNGKLYTLAYRRADGTELWRREAPAAKIEPFHKTESSPAGSTPATDGERVVSYFGSCGLFCYDLDGKELWRYELPTAATTNDFGTGSSPVIGGDRAILQRDQMKDSKLLAVDLKTGSLVWEVKRDGVSTSWGSACVWDAPGGPQVVVAGGFRLTGYDLATGAEKWVVKGLPAVPCTTPVVADGRLVYAGWSPGGADFKLPTFDDMLKQVDKDGDGAISKAEGAASPMLANFFDNNDLNKDGRITRDEWDGQVKLLAAGRNVAFAVEPGGAGDVTQSHVAWTATKSLPYVPSPLVYRGVMYTLTMRGQLTARDVKTGKDVYTDEAVGLAGVYASPVAAGGYVYLCGLDGAVVVIKAGGEFPEKVSAAKLDARIAATPAVVDDTLYVRTGKTLYAFGK